VEGALAGNGGKAERSEDDSEQSDSKSARAAVDLLSMRIEYCCHGSLPGARWRACAAKVISVKAQGCAPAGARRVGGSGQEAKRTPEKEAGRARAARVANGEEACWDVEKTPRGEMSDEFCSTQETGHRPEFQLMPTLPAGKNGRIGRPT
jgi:hypothetical protein